MAKIPLRNKAHEIVAYALVDKEDEERVSKFSWCFSASGYAQTSIRCETGKTKSIKMHRFVLGAKPEDPCIDHKNHIKIDNQRGNLSFVSASFNSHNQQKRKNTSSHYTGVHFAKDATKQWQVTCFGKYRGCYDKEIDAAFAYNLAAVEVFGPNANLNDVAKPADFIQWVTSNNSEYVNMDGKKCKGLTIRRTKNGSIRYRATVSINGKMHDKQFTDLKQATEQYLAWKRLANEVKPIVEEEIPRNERGIALLPCKQYKSDIALMVQVDDNTYRSYVNYPCSLGASGYPRICLNGTLQLLHRLVMNAEPSRQLVIDHKDRDKLNAQEVNLRVVSHSLNAHNRGKAKTTSSQYMGVSIIQTRYCVRMAKDGIYYYGGQYADEQVAGWAADQLAHELFGEDARSNNVQLEGYVFANRRAVQTCQRPAFKKQKTQHNESQ